MENIQKFSRVTLVAVLLTGAIFAAATTFTGSTHSVISTAQADTNCSVALALTDRVSNASPNVGDTITYTLTGSPAFTAATQVTVTDTLGSGLTFVSATPSIGTYDSATGVWSLGTLNGASQISLSIVATVNSGTEGQTISNNPGIMYVQTNCTQSSAVTGVSINVQSPAPVTPTSTPVATTSTLIVVTNVENSNGATSTASSFTDTINGANVQPTSTFAGSASGVTVSLTAGSYSVIQSSIANYMVGYSLGCSGNLAAGATVTCTITDTFIAPVVQTPTSTCVLSATDFEIALQNGTLTYQGISSTTSTASISITNDTSCSAPVSLASYEMFEPINAAQWLSTQQIIDSASSSIPAGSTQTLTVNLASCKTQVDAYYGDAPTTLLDTNPYYYPNVPFVFTWLWTASNLCGITTPTSTPSADLSVTKTVDNSTPSVGATVNYTVTVSALGPATSTGVVATDTLPSGLTFENATASVGTYASSTGTWTIGDLAASSTATLDIAAQVASGTASTTITNTATVGESASSTDNNLSNNSSSVAINVQTPVCTSNCGGGGGVVTPTSTTLTVNVAGLNASDTAELSVADLTASTTQSTSTGNGTRQFVLSTNDNYAVTATTTAANYTVATSTGCAGTLANAATCNVTFTFASSTTTSTVPVTDAGIEVTKTVDNANPAPGANVTYTITVSALGPATSTIVAAQDILPGGLSLVSASASVGTYDMSTGNWTIGNLSASSTATLTIVAAVGSNEAGQTITNTATVSELSSLVNPDSANTSSSVSINVQTPACTSNCGGGGGTTTGGGGGGGGGGGSVATAEIAIAKTVDNANPNPGDTIHYTLTVSARGPSESIGVVATDTLPSGVTFVSASSSAGTYASSTGTWTIGSVVEGSSDTLVITATVNSSDPIGEAITNTATVKESSNVNDPLTGNNSSSVMITVGGSNGGGGGTTTTGGGGGGTSGGGGGGSTGGGGGTGGGQVLGASASCGIYLDEYIHPIRKNLNNPIEVEKLQTFLNMNLGTTLPITGYYGSQTIAAVDQFQVKYHTEVLQPWLSYGLPTEYTPTDYVYKTTQRWINLIMCSSLNLPIPQLP